MANDFVQIASSGGNVLEIPLKIEKFIPKRIGHVEHASVYKLDFWSVIALTRQLEISLTS